MASIRILHQIQVSPSLPSQPPQHLSFLDKIWLHNNQPVERLFFYRFPHPTSHFLANILPAFAKSLSLALHHFYPLAGSIRPCPDPDVGFEIVYTDGDTVALTVAEFTGEDFHNISTHRQRNLESLRLLLPKPAKSSSCNQVPPISIQTTLFPNQGLSIGFAINHAVCDGSSSMQFIRSWAAAFRSTEPDLRDIPPPLLDRSIIADTHDTQRKLIEMLLQYKEVLGDHSKKLPPFDTSLIHATLTLPKDRILQLKKRMGKQSPHISTFVVSCGYVWRCLLKAKGYEGDHTKEYFMCAVDWRKRMRPAISSDYFGNCLGVLMAGLQLGEILGENGIELAAIEIGKSVVELEGKDVGEAILEVADYAMKGEMRKPLSVAGSAKLRVYETDFGWGRPVRVDVVSIHETAAISLAESGEEEGGVEIGLVLGEEEMDEFVRIFSADLLDI